MLTEEAAPASLQPAEPATQQLPPPSAALIQMMFGKHISFTISAVARLGVADHMRTESATPIADLAAATGAHSPSLYRAMRMLSSVGVFEETSGKSFRLTPVSELLRTEAPGSMRYTAIQMGEPWGTRAFENFADTLRTGTDGVTLAFGKHIWDYFAEMPEEAEVFNRSMTNMSGALMQPIAEAYDFSGIEQLADVGGGHGMLLSAILQRNPKLRGVVFDLPNVIAGAPEEPFIAPLRDRLEFEAGNFFEGAPSGCDAYLLKFILHDWSDDLCGKILLAIRKEMPANGRVLVCEQLISSGHEPSMAQLLDIEMLTFTVGGRERTADEFSDLFAAAGLRLNRVIPTSCPLFILEAVCA